MFFFKSHQTTAPTLLLHIDGASVAGAVMFMDPNGKARLQGVRRESIVLREKHDGHEPRRIRTSLVRLLDGLESDLKLLRPAPKPFARVEVALSGSLAIGALREEIHQHDRDFVLTKAILSPMVSKGLMAAKDDLPHSSSSVHAPHTYALLDAPTLVTKLNGYETTAPLGKKARLLEVYIQANFTTENLFAELTEALTPRFPRAMVRLSAFTDLSRRAAAIIAPELTHFICVCVGSEDTSVSVVRNRRLIFETTIPFGHNQMIRTMAAELNVLPDMARSYLSLYEAEKITPDLAARIKTLRDKVFGQWLTAFNRGLMASADEIFIPRHVFVITEEAMGDAFLSFLKRDAAARYMADDGQGVMLLSSHGFSHVLATADGAAADSFLSLMAFVHRQENPGKFESWYDTRKG